MLLAGLGACSKQFHNKHALCFFRIDQKNPFDPSPFFPPHPLLVPLFSKEKSTLIITLWSNYHPYLCCFYNVVWICHEGFVICHKLPVTVQQLSCVERQPNTVSRFLLPHPPVDFLHQREALYMAGWWMGSKEAEFNLTICQLHVPRGQSLSKDVNWGCQRIWTILGKAKSQMENSQNCAEFGSLQAIE